MNTPPKTLLRFFRWFCHPELKPYIEGDLMELYDERIKRSGKRKANWRFALDVLLLFRPGIIRPSKGNIHSNNYAMLKSYFTIGWRSLLKNKGYSFINVTGLAAGMTVAILIGLWVNDELSFDSYFKNHEKIAQVLLNQTNQDITYTGPTVSSPIEDVLRTKYKDDFTSMSLVSWDERPIVAMGDKSLTTESLWVQSEFPEMFSLSMTSGSRSALKDASTTLISQSLAKALYGSEDILNKSIRVGNEMDLIVGGVFEDFPNNTSFYGTKLLLPWTHPNYWNNKNGNWNDHSCRLFVQLADPTNVGGVSEKIKNVPTPFIKAWKEEITLQLLDDVHLYNEFEEGKAAGGRIQYVWLMGIIGTFVLMLACINFMNLSTARSEKRSKEVGIRKTIGSLRYQLVGQFLAESIVVAAIGLVFSITITQLSLPYFNALTEKNMSILWGSQVFWVSILGFALFCGLVSGSYPAFYLSSFSPVKVLKGTFKTGRLGSMPRKVLVVAQFTVSIVLIIGTAIVYQQIQFAKNRPVGFNREGLITISISTPDLEKHYDLVRNELLQTGLVEGVSKSSQSLAHFNNNNSMEYPGKDPTNEIFFQNVSVSADFGKTVGWTIKEGRDFMVDNPADSSAIILNEATINVTQLKNPIGETVKFWGENYTVIGIVGDMLTQSPYDPNAPSLFILKGWKSIITIRIKSQASAHDALARIEPIFKKYNPAAPFEARFVDDVYARKYSDEEKIGKLATLFASLAIFISCLGLFGLASFVAEQRTKEIGIRKVMGASLANVWKMLSRDFIILVMISFFISVPLASYFLTAWLKKYSYHTEISWWIFISTGIGALLITMGTISFQAIKAGLANPVKSLRSE